jgi:hypothetical protein
VGSLGEFFLAAFKSAPVKRSGKPRADLGWVAGGSYRTMLAAAHVAFSLRAAQSALWMDTFDRVGF